ncbi:MAG: ABC transporter substrate-binding protein [Acidobacteria bacterium]|nr:ABC transporter substrate-binding protein [Acidobacteriota bacterium]
MTNTFKLVVAIFWVAFALPVLLAGYSATAPRAAQQSPQRSQADAEQARALVPQERRGKAIYLRGESSSGKEITAVVGEVDLPASTLPCAGCHGLRGEGKTEGGVTAGSITWANLTKPYGHTHPSGRKHGPFNEASFIRATVNGYDPAGNELAVVMPRHKMSPADMADLIAYLKRIEFDRDPGLADTAIKVGSILPSKGPLADTGAAIRDVLTAYFDQVNARGGVFSRKIELRVADMGTDAAATAANARRLIEQEEIFAVVGGVSAGADDQLAAVAREMEIPIIGPATLMPRHASPLNRYIFYLLPGLAEQSRALCNFAASLPELKNSRVVILYRDSEIVREAAAAAENQARRSGWSSVVKQAYPPMPSEVLQLVQRLKEEKADAVFFLGGGGEEATLIRAAAAVNWTPHIFLLGALMGKDLVGAVPSTFKGKVFVAFPTAPTDITPEGVAEFRTLQEKYKFAPRHAASQLAAFAAAKIFVEGLQRAGQNLSREKLITALEGLNNYDTGVTLVVVSGWVRS